MEKKSFWAPLMSIDIKSWIDKYKVAIDSPSDRIRRRFAGARRQLRHRRAHATLLDESGNESLATSDAGTQYEDSEDDDDSDNDNDNDGVFLMSPIEDNDSKREKTANSIRKEYQIFSQSEADTEAEDGESKYLLSSDNNNNNHDDDDDLLSDASLSTTNSLYVEYDDHIDERRTLTSTSISASSGKQTTSLINWTYYRREFRKRLPYYVPIVGWLPRYRWRDQLGRDVLAGVSTGAMLVPQCLAYALIAKVPPVVGLYAGWMPLLVYFLLGTSRQMAVGPEGLVALLIGSTLSNFADANALSKSADVLWPYGAVLAFWVGLFTLALGVLRVGFFDNLVSAPALHGFITASALLIIIEQLEAFFGLPPVVGERSYEKVASFFRLLPRTNVLTVCIAFASVVMLLGIDYAKRALSLRWPRLELVPTIVIVVALGIGVGAGLDVASREPPVHVLGRVQSGFIDGVPSAPAFWDVGATKSLVLSAALIALIGFVESMVVAKRYAAKHRYQVSANRELVALGSANLVGSFFGAFPVFGSLPRSVVQDGAGATSQLSGAVASFVSLAGILFLLPIFEQLPLSVIAAIIVVAASNLIEPHHFVLLARLRAWLEFGLAIVAFAATFLLGPELGILIALAISLYLVVKHTTQPNIAILGRKIRVHDHQVDNEGGADEDGDDDEDAGIYRDILHFPMHTELVPGIMILRIDESLYFANAPSFREIVERVYTLGHHLRHPTDASILQTPLLAIVLDMRSVPIIDPQAIQTLVEIAILYRRRNLRFAFVQLQAKFRQRLLAAYALLQAHDKTNEEAAIGANSFFTSIDAAIEFIQKAGHVSYSSYDV
jgi:high affinity sulfate transporter 1